MTRFACRSDPGRRHQQNQDLWYADPQVGLYFVTDGMANGVAPRAVVDLLPPLLAQVAASHPDLASESLADGLQETLRTVNEQVREAMAAAGEIGLGATLVLALVRPPRALVAHVGDSRCYLFRDGTLEQLTRDHSLVQRLVDLGTITPEEARQSRGNGGPTRFLGQSGEVAADLRIVDLSPGDQLLLCSDGLTGMLTDEQIEAVFQKQPSAERICQQLVDAANAAGGSDNVTVVVIEAA